MLKLTENKTNEALFDFNAMICKMTERSHASLEHVTSDGHDLIFIEV